MKLYGLTGGIACGKSTVVDAWRSGNYGDGVTGPPPAHIIDCDVVVRDLQRPGTTCLKKIAQRWGDAVMLPSGELNREALGRIIFQDPKERAALGRIMNHAVFLEVIRRLWVLWWRLPADAVVVVDAPLFFENRVLHFVVGPAVVVSADRATQVQRLFTRNQLAPADATRRIDAQMPLSKKEALAVHVIHNGADVPLDDLKRRAADALSVMGALPGPKPWQRGWSRFMLICAALALLIPSAAGWLLWKSAQLLLAL